jgi:hypothetical protein
MQQLWCCGRYPEFLNQATEQQLNREISLIVNFGNSVSDSWLGRSDISSSAALLGTKQKLKSWDVSPKEYLDSQYSYYQITYWVRRSIIWKIEYYAAYLKSVELYSDPIPDNSLQDRYITDEVQRPWVGRWIVSRISQC